MKAKKGEAPVFHVEAQVAPLLRAVSRVAAVIEKRNTIPILGCVELAVGIGTLAIRGTDLDLEARAEIEARGDGALCLPAVRLRDLLKAVQHVEEVEMTAGADGVVTLTAGEVTATMNSLAAFDLPNLAIGSRAWDAKLAEGVMRFLVGGVEHAISKEETRYYLNGVCLEVVDGLLVAVATDGHRLATREHRLVNPPTNQGSAIVPRKAVAVALGYSGLGEATLSLHRSADGERVAFAEVVADGMRLRCKLIDGTFPDWRRVVPQPSNTVVEVETKALRRALRATATASEGRRDGRATKFVTGASGIVLSSHNPDSGTTRARIECPITGQMPEFGVNGRYLDETAAAMERIGSKTMRLHVSGSGNPVRIVPDEAIAGALNVIMPMRV